MIERIVVSLEARRFSHTSEAELQEAIAEVFQADGIPFQREVVFGRERLDFMVGDVAVEVKIKGRRAALIAQLYRYAKRVRFRAIVVATTRAQHRDLPLTILGVPVYVAYLGHP